MAEEQTLGTEELALTRQRLKLRKAQLEIQLKDRPKAGVTAALWEELKGVNAALFAGASITDKEFILEIKVFRRMRGGRYECFVRSSDWKREQTITLDAEIVHSYLGEPEENEPLQEA